MKKKKTGKKKWIVLIAVILAVVVLSMYFRYHGRAADGDNADGQNSAGATAAVTIGSIAVTAEGTGSIEAASTKAVALEYDGKLDTIYVETGDQVRVGDVLAEYDADALDSVLDSKETELKDLDDRIANLDDSGSSSISAKVSGRIKRIYAAVDNRVASVMDQYGCLAEISADGKLKVEFEHTGKLVPGDNVTVEFDAYTEEGMVTEAEDTTATVTIDDDTEYKVDQEAEIYDRSGQLLGHGMLQSNAPYLVTAEYGIIDTVKVDKETSVSAGDTLFTLTDYKYNQDYIDLLRDRKDLVEELKELRDYQKNPEVVSEYDGYITTLDVMEGMTYEKDQQFCTVADTNTLYLKVDIDELDIDGVEAGQTADVVFDAFEDETYEGTVKKVSGVGVNTGGVTTYTVTIELQGSEKLKNAMSATAKIMLESKDNVLLVPVDAVTSEEGAYYVTLVTNGAPAKTEVSVGLINEEYAEITDGLNAGDLVEVPEMEHTGDFMQQMMAQRQSNAGQSTFGQ